jgi:TldD protein
MKRATCIASVVLLTTWALSSSLAAAAQPSDTIVRAMTDELARNLSNLEMEGFARPYFVSYTVDDIQKLTIKASLGTVTKSKLERSRYVTVDLRVGERALDNTNFFPAYSIVGPDYTHIALDNDYDAIRNAIYLLTDKAYKDALKVLSSKEAYLQNRVIRDRPADLVEEHPHRFSGHPEDFDIVQSDFEDLARRASEVFKDYPMIAFSQLGLTATITNQYFVSSSGTSAVRGDRVYSITIAMNGRGADGEDVFSDGAITVSKPEDLPRADSLVRWVRTNADEMTAGIAAEKGEEYSGPVIFVGDAAGEFFEELFAKNISGIPAPLFEKEDMERFYSTPRLEERIGRRVLPSFIDVYDDPSLDHYGGADLIGAYEIDDAGQRPEKIQIVKDGKLIDLPIGTAPTRKISEPNGHARGAVGRMVKGRPSNLLIESSQAVSLDEMKKEMLDICRDYGLEYGLIVEKLGDQNAPYEGRPFFHGGPPGEAALSDPVRAYKVFPDGREEPVRNLEFANVTLRVLRDIIEIGKKQYVHNYLIGGDDEMPASIVCPAFLIEEMELKEPDVTPRKPPILPSPLAESVAPDPRDHF